MRALHKLTDTHPAGSAQPCPAGKEREKDGVEGWGVAIELPILPHLVPPAVSKDAHTCTATQILA